MNVEEFNTRMLGEHVQWFDKVGLYRLSTENTAKIILSTRERDGNYVGYKVTIINRRNGVIEGKFFNINHYVTPDVKVNKKNNKLKQHTEYYIQMVRNSIAFNVEPEDTEPLREAIFKYIAFFR